MPEYARANKEQDGAASKSLLSSLVRWLEIKKYQYEVTFSLYMLTSTEKAVFSTSTTYAGPNLTLRKHPSAY
jgi:hypothetical protein